MASLIIIDVQNDFLGDLRNVKGTTKTRRFINNVCATIKEFRKKNYEIILLNYKNCGKVHDSVMNALENFNHRVIYKNADDGGMNLKKHLSNHNKLVFCGMNTNFCVKDTIFGTKFYYPQKEFSLVKKASICTWSDESGAYQEFSKNGISIL